MFLGILEDMKTCYNFIRKNVIIYFCSSKTSLSGMYSE